MSTFRISQNFGHMTSYDVTMTKTSFLTQNFTSSFLNRGVAVYHVRSYNGNIWRAWRHSDKFHQTGSCPRKSSWIACASNRPPRKERTPLILLNTTKAKDKKGRKRVKEKEIKEKLGKKYFSICISNLGMQTRILPEFWTLSKEMISLTRRGKVSELDIIYAHHYIHKFN